MRFSGRPAARSSAAGRGARSAERSDWGASKETGSTGPADGWWAPCRPAGGWCHRGGDWNLRAGVPTAGSSDWLPALVEPCLEQHGGRDPVHEFAPLARRNATLAQPPGGFHGRQPLIDQLDLPPRRIGQRLGKPAGSLGFLALVARPIERQTHQEPFDFIGSRERDQIREQAALVAARERRSRVGNEAKLVGDRETYPYLSEINGGHTHP